MLLVEQAIRWMEDALGGPLSQDIERLEVLNQAGQYMVGMRDWRWLGSRTATLDKVAGDPFVPLPADCARILSLRASDSLSRDARLVPIDTVNLYRTSSFQGEYQRDLCAVAYRQNPGGGPPKLGLECWPVPDADAPSSITVVYAAGWYTVTADTQALSLPEWCEGLYLEILCAVAKGIQEADIASTSARVEEIKRGPAYRSAMRRDRVQVSYGRTRNGILERRPDPEFGIASQLAEGPSE